MKCPFCASISDKVIDSRQSKDGAEIRRRRECEECARRFTTYERIEDALPLVIKKDGRREPFDRAKLVGGLKHACAKRPVPLETLEQLALDVEREVGELGEKEIESKSIGERVLPRLRLLDEVAYVRFASIYRSFRDVDEFLNEVSELMKTRATGAASIRNSGRISG
ncbi:MAG: transcriptional repressor NrdR [Deltaproteobacteria bacterium]|nr:transcriptional repressor NrdR [Deltaproteobacteria bacterium]